MTQKIKMSHKELKTRITRTAIILLLIFVAVGCKPKSSDTEFVTHNIRAEYRAFDQSYQSPSIEEAERALLHLKEAIESWRKLGVKGRDFDQELQVVHARLFGLYYSSGQVDLRDKYFDLVIARASSNALKRGINYVPRSKEALLTSILKADSNLSVLWRTNK